MKTTRYRLALALMSLVVLLLLVGCSQGASSGRQTAAPVAVQGTAETAATPAATPSPQPEATPTAASTSRPAVPAPPAAAAAAPVEVPLAIQLFAFKPATLTIDAGTQVVWTNQDDIEHSVTEGRSPQAGGAFDSGLFTKGKTFAHTFNEPGSYSYFCTRHPSMQGTVVVEAP